MTTSEQLLALLADISERLDRVEKKLDHPLYEVTSKTHGHSWVTLHGLPTNIPKTSGESYKVIDSVDWPCPLRDNLDAKVTPERTPFMDRATREIASNTTNEK